MIKTQVQLPDDLYKAAKRVAREREMSLAEVMRRGLEYIVRVYPPIGPQSEDWRPPSPHSLGSFQAPGSAWRSLANDPADHASS